MKACIFRHLGGCRGKVQEHHLLKQRRIRRAHRTAVAEHRRGGPEPFSLTSALLDDRNRVGLCVGHHEKVTACHPRFRIDPPAEAFMFAEEIGLAGSLEADVARRVA